ncbi:MAG: hypothetical protein J3R72DRAFT_511106, partial [Linnemannia gamsii]
SLSKYNITLDSTPSSPYRLHSIPTTTSASPPLLNSSNTKSQMTTREDVNIILLEATLDALTGMGSPGELSSAVVVVVPVDIRILPDSATRSHFIELYFKNHYLTLPMVQREVLRVCEENIHIPHCLFLCNDVYKAGLVYLGLTTLCITERTSSDEDSSHLASQQNALKKESTAYVKSLLRPIVDVGLERVSFDWESSLDMCALNQDIRGSKCKALHLEFKTGDQEVSSVVVNSDLGVHHLKCDTEFFVMELGATYLVERAESVELLSKEGSFELAREAIYMAIQRSSVLRMLTLDCKGRGHDFKLMVKTIQNIVEPFYDDRVARLPLRDLIIIDRTDNDVTALFDLTQPYSEDYCYPLPIALDVTSRFSTMTPSGGSMPHNQTVSSLLKVYGSVGRVLHLIGPTPSCLNQMADLLDSATDPKNLVSLTLRLDHLRENHVYHLFDILSSSKNTFKQLTLIGNPKDSEEEKAATKLLDVLEALGETVKDVRVLVTRIHSDGIEDWVTSVKKAIDKTSSTLLVVDTAQELRMLVQGITKNGFAVLEAIFAGKDSVKRGADAY